MDQLIINSLIVPTKIGVYHWEQQIDQNVLIDLIIPFDSSTCDDKLSNTVDYELLCLTITEFVQSRSFQLIETIANEVAQLVQQKFSIDSLTVKVSKPHAIKNAGPVQVIVNR